MMLELKQKTPDGLSVVEFAARREARTKRRNYPSPDTANVTETPEASSEENIEPSSEVVATPDSFDHQTEDSTGDEVP